ncbi:MAG: thioredoxin family protein [Clostridiaceae bacterium]|nr:thioredoxin family protein [Clostridiaceae bacterium]
MKIKILGTGCSKCRIIEENLETALQELKLAAEVTSEGKLIEIVRYGVMITPALVIDEKVVYAGGKALSVEELKALISKQ